MITRYLIIACATISFINNAMEKKFDLSDILLLAKKDRSYQPFIETYFGLELSAVKQEQLLSYRFIELQNAVLYQVGNAQASEAAKACLLDHLQLAYQKKQSESHKASLDEAKKKIEEILKKLDTQQGAT